VIISNSEFSKGRKMPDKVTLAAIAAAVVAFLALSAGSAQAGTITVGPGGGYDFTSIQAAINAAGLGDTVIVAPGRYYENINFNGKSIIVTSTNPNDPAIVADTIIDAGGSGNVVTFANREGPETVLAGFTVTGGHATGGFPTGYGGGIHCCEAEPTITNCIVYGNSASTGGGMYCADGSPKLLSCTFSGNSASVSGGGIFTHYDSFPTLINSTFSGNSAGVGGGIDVFYGCPIVLINCTFSNNTASDNGGGICISDHSLFGGGGPSILTNCTFSGNTASGNGGAIYCSEAA
jgi:predicted outer membrane repeat protein/parallel beta-helix repeat protein